MVKGSGIGSFGGGALEHPRQRLGAQWAGLSPGSAEPPRAARCGLRRRRSRGGAGAEEAQPQEAQAQEPSWSTAMLLRLGFLEQPRTRRGRFSRPAAAAVAQLAWAEPGRALPGRALP